MGDFELVYKIFFFFFPSYPLTEEKIYIVLTSHYSSNSDTIQSVCHQTTRGKSRCKQPGVELLNGFEHSLTLSEKFKYGLLSSLERCFVLRLLSAFSEKEKNA